MEKKELFLKRAVLIVSVVLILILILEISIRIILPEDVKHSFAAGFSRFEEKYVVLNEEGYRDAYHAAPKPKNTIRIAGLGDSFTFGYGIKNANKTYLKKLEYLLDKNSKNMNYEVLNFGKGGLDTENEIEILKEDVLKYKPDIIMVGYVLNDFQNVEVAEKGKSNFYLHWIDVYIERSSYLYSLAKKGLNNALSSLGLKKSYYQSIIDSFNSERNKEFNKLYFKELKNIAVENDATLVIVVFSFMYKLDDYPFEEAHEFLAEAGREDKIIIIDLLSYYKNYDEKDLVVSKYDIHPNELGHQIAANAIYEKLIKSKIVS